MNFMATKKYTLTKETLDWCERTLYRIKALIDIPNTGVKKGDLGGFVQGYENLSQEGECWVYQYAKVFDKARVWGEVLVSGEARVYGEALVSGKALVFGKSSISGTAHLSSIGRAYFSNITLDSGHFVINTNINSQKEFNNLPQVKKHLLIRAIGELV
jgi:hypothetical protein